MGPDPVLACLLGSPLSSGTLFPQTTLVVLVPLVDNGFQLHLFTRKCLNY